MRARPARLCRGRRQVAARRAWCASGRLRWPALGCCALACCCLPVFLPYGALLNAAFSRDRLAAADARQRSRCTTSTSCSSSCRPTQLALKNTFLLGALAATCGTLLALVIAYLTRAQPCRGHRVLGFLATAPIAIPGIVLGVGLFLAYTRPPFVLYGTLWILLHRLRHHRAAGRLPAAAVGLPRRPSRSWRRPSRILGATRLRTLRDITAPLLRTSVIATWCFIFVAVVRELSAAMILFTSETKVLSVLIFDLKESGDLAAIAVLGLTMLVLTVARHHRRQPHPRLRRRAPAQQVRTLAGMANACRIGCRASRAQRIAALDRGAAAADVRETCERLLIDVVGLCVAARGTDYVHGRAARRGRTPAPCTAIGHARSARAPPARPSSTARPRTARISTTPSRAGRCTPAP